jgi:hypothetical protein
LSDATQALRDHIHAIEQGGGDDPTFGRWVGLGS